MALIFEVGHGDEKDSFKIDSFCSGKHMDYPPIRRQWDVKVLLFKLVQRSLIDWQTFTHKKMQDLSFLWQVWLPVFPDYSERPLRLFSFAMEVLVIGEMKFEALLPAFTASIAASTTSQALGLSKFTFILSEDISFSWILLAQLLLLGLIFGVVGGLFAWCLKLVKRFFCPIK